MKMLLMLITRVLVPLNEVFLFNLHLKLKQYTGTTLKKTLNILYKPLPVC